MSTPEPAKPAVPTPPAPPAPPQPPAPPAPPQKDSAITDAASPAATCGEERSVQKVRVEPEAFVDLRHERLTGKVIKFEQNVSGLVKTDMFEEELVFKYDRIMAEFQTHNFADNESVEFDVQTDDHGKTIAVALKPMLNRKPNECLGQRHRGYVRRFAERWGFLNSAAFDGDLFVHRDNFLPVPYQMTGEPTLRGGQEVEFDVGLDDRGRAVAKQITTGGLQRPSDLVGHRLKGYIRSFQGAWGFITSDRFAGDLFVHRDSLLAQYHGAPLNMGTMVEFDVEHDHPRKGTKNRLVARHLAVLGGGELSAPPHPVPYPHPYPSPYHQGGLPPYQPSLYDHAAYAAYAAPQPSPYQPQAYGALPPSMYYGAPDPSWAAYGGYAPPQYPYGPYPQPAPYPQASPYAHPPYAQPPYPQAALSPCAPQPYSHPYPQPAAPVQPCPQLLPSPYGAVPPGSNFPAPQPQPAPYPPHDLTPVPVQPQPAVVAAPEGAVPVSADGQPEGLLHITMHDWEPDQPGQLLVTKGTLVNVSHRAAHGWVYAGTMKPGGQSSEPVTEGWIPQAVVKRVSLCRVILDWPPEGGGTLGVSKGEMIAVSKEAERGWVYGERIGPRQPDLTADGWLPRKILDDVQASASGALAV